MSIIKRDTNLIGLGNGKYDRAWFAGDESNVYEGYIPAEKVAEVLGSVHAVQGVSQVVYEAADGNMVTITDNANAPILDRNTGRIFRYGAVAQNGEHTGATYGYDALAQNVINALDVPDLGVSSLGLWDFGGSAYVQFEMPDSVTSGAGIVAAPFIGLTSSIDGTLGTNIGTGSTFIICRNTCAMFGLEAGRSGIRTRRTKNFADRVNVAAIREALDLAWTETLALTAELDKLAEFTVTDSQFSAFVQAMFPIKEDDAPRTVTSQERKRETLSGVYRTDERVATWTGTAFGVLQAVNTIDQHMTKVRATTDPQTGMATVADPYMRNIRAWAKGDADKTNRDALAVLNNVLKSSKARQLVLA